MSVAHIAALPWRKSILAQLQQRNEREQHPYSSIITTCNNLFEKIETLQREKLSLENNSSQHAAVNAANDRILQLQNDVAEYQSTITEHEATIETLTSQLSLLQAEHNELRSKHNDTVEILEATRQRCCSLQETTLEAQSQMNLVTDEHQALQIAYSSLKNKFDKMECQQIELVKRLLVLKEKDVELMNEENEKHIKIQNDKMKKQLQDAADEMAVSAKVVSEMESIPEEKIHNPLIVQACLPKRPLFSFEAHQGEVFALRWNPRDDLSLTTGGGDRKVKLWQIDESGVRLANTLTGSNGSITSIDILEDYLVASSNDNASRVWTLSDIRLRRTFTGHSNKVMSVKFLGANNQVVTGSHDKTLKIWDLNRNACVRTLFAGSSCNDLVNIDFQQTLVASAHFDKRIRFWDPRSEGNSNDILLQGKITSLDVSIDGRWLLCSVRDDTLKCLDLRLNQVIRDFTADGFSVGSDQTRAKFSPDNNYVACGSADGSIFVWNFMTGALEAHLTTPKHVGTVLAIEWHPKGHYFASADRNKNVVIWRGS